MFKRFLTIASIALTLQGCSTLNHYSVPDSGPVDNTQLLVNQVQTCAIHSISLEFCRFDSIEDACVLVFNQKKGVPVVELKNQLNYWKTYFKGRTVLNYQSCKAQYQKAYKYLEMISSQ